MIIELQVGKATYKLSCQENEKEKISELADLLDARIANLQRETKIKDDQTLLLIAALLLEEELQEVKSARRAQDDYSDELYEALAQTINNIANHIEKISEKFRSGNF